MGRLLEVMLYESLTALRSWDTAGLEVPGISLNFSEDELRNPEIAEKISWELDRFCIAPSRLTVEILETVIAMAENDTINRNIRALRDLGCPIDLDDFGTGHASIANIKRFAVDRIKIDRSFITQIDVDNEQQKLVSAILTMAESLNLATLAEGVENNAEHAVLRRLGCNYIQGFGVARPMPADAVKDWVRGYENRLAIQGEKTAHFLTTPKVASPTGESKTA
jgi:EAL domain-containing protein (putative c-di-GMP-specific phosphodiesterase class I)